MTESEFPRQGPALDPGKKDVGHDRETSGQRDRQQQNTQQREQGMQVGEEHDHPHGAGDTHEDDNEGRRNHQCLPLVDVVPDTFDLTEPSRKILCILQRLQGKKTHHQIVHKSFTNRDRHGTQLLER